MNTLQEVLKAPWRGFGIAVSVYNMYARLLRDVEGVKRFGYRTVQPVYPSRLSFPAPRHLRYRLQKNKDS